MEYFHSNLKSLRETRGLTQEELAKKLGINRSVIGSYEEKRAFPKLPVLLHIAHYFGVTIDDLAAKDISKQTDKTQATIKTPDITGKNLRILSTIMDSENRELITAVPVKAVAGYARGFEDPDFIGQLPRFALPLPELSKERTYRLFQIEGESMEPIPSGSYIICEYIQDWHEVSDGKTYVIITHDHGLVFKRVYNLLNTKGQLNLVSDNPEFSPYNIDASQILEVWKALGYISFHLPDEASLSLQKLTHIVNTLKGEVDKIKNIH